MRNLDFDFEIPLSYFAIKREIQGRISTPRNPSIMEWISIKKSNSGFHGFPTSAFYCEIRKRINKTVLVTSDLFTWASSSKVFEIGNFTEISLFGLLQKCNCTSVSKIGHAKPGLAICGCRFSLPNTRNSSGFAVIG